MTEEHTGSRTSRRWLVSLLLLLLIWGALDDITTDPYPTHAAEYFALACAGAWFFAEALRLRRRGHRILSAAAVTSLAAGAAAVYDLSRTGEMTARPTALHLAALLPAMAACLGLTAWSALRTRIHQRGNAALDG